jgi:class 3 adenylate cyclase
VTFLFTSIQDSLRRWDEAPAEMAAAKGVHDAMVRDAIEGHGGHVFATDGDSFCAAFATAASAAGAAVEAQRKLRADATIGIAVRMVCTPERRSGMTATTPGARSTGRHG